jgi:hypothetical protein
MIRIFKANLQIRKKLIHSQQAQHKENVIYIYIMMINQSKKLLAEKVKKW